MRRYQVIADLGHQEGTSQRGAWTKDSLLLEEVNENYPKKLAVEFFNKQPHEIPVVGTVIEFEPRPESRESSKNPGQWFTGVTMNFFNTIQQAPTAMAPQPQQFMQPQPQQQNYQQYQQQQMQQFAQQPQQFAQPQYQQPQQQANEEGKLPF